MRRRLLPILVVSILSVFLGSCALVQSLLRSFRQPTMDFKNVTLSDPTLAGVTVNLVYTLRNPNPIGVTLAEVRYALSVEGKQVVAGQPPHGLNIPAQGRTDVILPAQVRFADLGNVLQTFLAQDVAHFRAEGSLGIQTPIGVVRLPIAKEGQFEVPKVPQASFASPRIAQISLTNATVEFPLTLTSKNSFPLPLGGIAGNVTIAGAHVGTLSVGEVGVLAPKSTRTLKLPLTINFLQAAAAANALRRGNAQVQFSGQLQSGGASAPLNLNQMLTFVQ